MALAATLVGFGFLVVALVTGTLWLAVACIAVCVIGGVFLIADLLGIGAALSNRRSRRAPASVGSAGLPEDDMWTDDVPTDDGAQGSIVSADADLADTEVTTEFPRIQDSEPIVSLDDPESAWHNDIGDSAAAGMSETETASTESVETPTAEPAPAATHRHSAHARGDDETPLVEAAHHGRHETDDSDVPPHHLPRHGNPD